MMTACGVDGHSKQISVVSCLLWLNHFPANPLTTRTSGGHTHNGSIQVISVSRNKKLSVAITRTPRSQSAHLKVGWRGKFFLTDQNQHVSKPTWVKLQCNRHSRSTLKSVLKIAKLAPSEKNVFKRTEPNRPFIWVWWLVNGQALKVDRFLPGFPESVPIFGTPHNHWHILRLYTSAKNGSRVESLAPGLSKQA